MAISGTHSFSVKLAEKYGVEAALLINHFSHWISHNQRMKRNFHEGRTWTYQTREDIAAYFPYLDANRVRRLCEELVKKKVIVKGNFNKTHFDRTIWYAFTDEFIEEMGGGNSNNSYERQNCQMETADLPHQYHSLKQPLNPEEIKRECEGVPTSSSPSPSAPPVSRSKKKAPEEKREVAPEVWLTPTQEIRFLQRCSGNERLRDASYLKLSDWKVGSGKTGGKNDFLSLTRWALEAARLDEANGTMRPAAAASSDEEFIRIVEKEYKKLIDNMDIITGHNYIEFPRLRDAHYKIGIKGFKEIVKNQIRKIQY